MYKHQQHEEIPSRNKVIILIRDGSTHNPTSILYLQGVYTKKPRDTSEECNLMANQQNKPKNQPNPQRFCDSHLGQIPTAPYPARQSLPFFRSARTRPEEKPITKPLGKLQPNNHIQILQTSKKKLTICSATAQSASILSPQRLSLRYNPDSGGISGQISQGSCLVLLLLRFGWGLAVGGGRRRRAFNGFEIRNWRGPKGTMCGGPRAAPGRSFVRTGVMDGQDGSGV